MGKLAGVAVRILILGLLSWGYLENTEIKMCLLSNSDQYYTRHLICIISFEMIPTTLFIIFTYMLIYLPQVTELMKEKARILNLFFSVKLCS